MNENCHPYNLDLEEKEDPEIGVFFFKSQRLWNQEATVYGAE